jgi:hypothetical protein
MSVSGSLLRLSGQNLNGAHLMDSMNRFYLEQQGYTSLDAETLAEVAPWLGLAPAVCSAVTAAATLTGSGLTLLLLAPLGVVAATTARHPAEWIADRTVRRDRRAVRPIPLAGAPRRFAYAFAATWLVVAGMAFLSGMPTLGTALGVAFAVATGVAAATGFCLGCELWNLWQRLRPSRSRLGAEAWPMVRVHEEDV